MRKFFVILGIVVLAAGCARPEPKVLSPSDAHQKLVTILKEENNLEVVTKEFEHSLWIYLPLEEGFLELKAKQEPIAPPSSTPSEPLTVHFLDGNFNSTERNFVIRYDIGPAKTYAKDPGYTSALSEDYQNKQRNILTAVSRAYTNADNPPISVTVVIADIVNGLEARVLFHLDDLKRAYSDQTFYGEYAKRVISDQPFGDPAIIGDKDGDHVDYHDILMPEFLAKQMVFRINFKYTRSAFPPAGTPTEEILKVVAETVDAYNFTDFGAVKLEDLNEGLSETVGQKMLEPYRPEPSKGRLIHIKFQ